MTGARIVLDVRVRAARARRDLGLAALCISGGMGMAVVLERA